MENPAAKFTEFLTLLPEPLVLSSRSCPRALLKTTRKPSWSLLMRLSSPGWATSRSSSPSTHIWGMLYADVFASLPDESSDLCRYNTFKPLLGLAFHPSPLEFWCLVLDNQHHDQYTIVVPLWISTFHACLERPELADVLSEYRRPSCYGLGFPCSCLYVNNLSRRLSMPTPATVFTMAVGLAMAGLELDMCPIYIPVLTPSRGL